MKELLNVSELAVDLFTEGKTSRLIDKVSFHVNQDEIIALVGESGCGKTVSSLAVSRLLPKNILKIESGEIIFQLDGSAVNICELDIQTLKEIRGKSISYIFQDPFTSLNPIKKISEQMLESWMIHNIDSPEKGWHRAEFLLKRVGVSDTTQRMNSIPSQLSGGLLQRVSIAMSLMCNPALVIADEPTSAIDVTIQRQLIELLLELKRENKMSMMFISHDIALVSSIADRIYIMYAGQIAETGTADEIIDSPKHPYTKALIGSIPSNSEDRARLQVIEGIVPDPSQFNAGCRFASRCELVKSECWNRFPESRKLSDTHKVNCWGV